MKTFKKHNREDIDSDSDLEYENYRIEDVGLDLKDVNASKTIGCLICANLHKNVKKLTTWLLWP